MIQKKLISVCNEDDERLMVDCVNVFIKEHPELEGSEFTRAFMFRKVIDFYLK